MEMTPKDKFESLWADFMALFKGKLIKAAEKQALSMPLARLILTDAAASWFSAYEINGRWLSSYSKEQPEKAAMIKGILQNDLSLQDMPKGGELPAYTNYALPLLGAGAGLAISYCLGAGRLVQAVSTIGPALLLYPAVKYFRKFQTDRNLQNAIDGYVAQLDKYYNSIVSILS